MNLLAALFLLTASSQVLPEPDIAVKHACMAQAQVIRNIYGAKMSGMSLQEVIAQIPSDWTPAMKTDAAHAAAQVYELDREALQKWFTGVMERCLKTGHGSSRD